MRLLLIACVGFVSQAWGTLGLSANPGSVPIGGQPFTLNVTFNGTGVPTAQSSFAVRWNGSVRPTTVAANSGQLSASITAADIAAPGFAEITVVNQATGVVYPAVTWVLITADVYVSDFAYDSVRNRFYVSVPTGNPRPGAPAESVVAVDASTGVLLSSINVGSKPGLMSISDDASSLYVYASGSSLISRIALSSFTQDLQISVPGAGFVSWMQVVPGAPHTLAVAQQSTGAIGTGALTIYDDAKARSVTAPGAPARFLFTDPQTIAGYTYLTSNNSYGIQAWKVSSSGVGPPTTIAGSSGPPVAYGDGWIVCSDGHAIDPTGARATEQLDLAGVGAFVPGQNRFLMLSYGNGNATPLLGAYEDVSMEALGRLQATLPYGSAPSQPIRMIVWGNDGLAFIANGELFFGHSELAAPAPAFTVAGTVNSATLTAGSISPGEIISIFGSNLGIPQGRSLEFSAPREVSTDLAETQVWFDGVPGSLLYAGGGQINVVAPFELAGKASTRVQVWYEGIPSAIVSMQVTAVAPGLFTQDASGKNASAALNSDGTLNTQAHPAAAGSYVAVYGTGGGETTPALADGQEDIYAWQLATNVQVLLNGAAIPAAYAGAAPDLVAGVIQVNFQIPASFPPSAAATVQLSIGGVLSPPGVTISTH